MSQLHTGTNFDSSTAQPTFKTFHKQLYTIVFPKVKGRGRISSSFLS